MDPQKQQLRSSIKAAKKASTHEQLATWSSALLQRLQRLPQFAAARTVLLYHSLPDEPDTHDFVERWAREKTVLLPVVVGEDLELRPYTSPASLATGAFSIQEPQGEAFTQYSQIDLALIPGVAFDPAGHRLGRGRGYYDRLLANPAFAHVTKVGICFPFQLVPNVPCEEHDVRMDIVIS